jgi:hypothetical protein
MPSGSPALASWTATRTGSVSSEDGEYAGTDALIAAWEFERDTLSRCYDFKRLSKATAENHPPTEQPSDPMSRRSIDSLLLPRLRFAGTLKSRQKPRSRG